MGQSVSECPNDAIQDVDNSFPGGMGKKLLFVQITC